VNDRVARAHARRPITSRLAFSPDEAAAALGVSRDFFDTHLVPELRIVRRGRRRLVPLRELERWLQEASSLPLDPPTTRPRPDP
jgi:excisionase family DNA binding protein